MKCYNHTEVDGVGICYHCHKAICKDCSTIVADRLSCIGECENNVKEITNYLDEGIKVLKTNKEVEKDWYSSSIMLIIIGLIFSIFDLINSKELGFAFSLGLVLSFCGFYSLYKTYSYSKKKKKNI